MLLLLEKPFLFLRDFHLFLIYQNEPKPETHAPTKQQETAEIGNMSSSMLGRSSLSGKEEYILDRIQNDPNLVEDQHRIIAAIQEGRTVTEPEPPSKMGSTAVTSPPATQNLGTAREGGMSFFSWGINLSQRFRRSLVDGEANEGPPNQPTRTSSQRPRTPSTRSRRGSSSSMTTVPPPPPQGLQRHEAIPHQVGAIAIRAGLQSPQEKGMLSPHPQAGPDSYRCRPLPAEASRESNRDVGTEMGAEYSVADTSNVTSPMIDETNKDEHQGRYRMFQTILVVVIALGIGIGVGWAVSKHRKGSSSSSSSQNSASNVTTGGSLNATQLQQEQETYATLRDHLQYLSSNNSVFDDVSSPQYKALNWLVHDQLLEANNTSRSAVQIETRYALATFYYATGGPGWWDQFGFLSPANECEWYGNNVFQGCVGGVRCDANHFVANLTLGEQHGLYCRFFRQCHDAFLSFFLGFLLFLVQYKIDYKEPYLQNFEHYPTLRLSTWPTIS